MTNDSQQRETYAAAFQRLKDAASKLQSLSTDAEPDVDKLEPLVEQATEAYTACMRRIAAVRQMLAAKFSPDAVNEKATRKGERGEQIEADIPFGEDESL